MATPTPEQFRDAMSAVPSAVTVIAASTGAGPAGATANAVASLSLDPPLMLVCLDRGSRTLVALRETGRFAVNVLGSGDEALARRFASKAPVDEKWSGVEWSLTAGVPKLAGALAWIACDLRDLLDGGDHVIVTGSVAELEISKDAAPLVFHAGDYRAID